MKKIKLLGLAAVAVLALSAFMGVASASAATTLCGVSTNPCPAANVLASGDALSGSLAKHGGATTAVLTGSFFGAAQTVTCTTSSVSGTVGTNPGTPATGNVTSTTFGGCHDQFGGNCTATTNATSTAPWAVTVSTPGSVMNSNGDFTVTVGTATVTCGFGSCQFGSTATVTNKVTGSVWNPSNANAPDTTNAHAQVFFNGVTLNSKTANCGNGTWTGNYAVTTTSTHSPAGDVWVF